MFATNSKFANDFIFSTHYRRPQTMNFVTKNNLCLKNQRLQRYKDEKI